MNFITEARATSLTIGGDPLKKVLAGAAFPYKRSPHTESQKDIPPDTVL